MRQVTIVLSLLLLCAPVDPVAAQPQQWQKTTVGDSVTVEFPGTPKKKEMESKLGPTNVYVLNDGTALYMVMVQKDAMAEESGDDEIAEFYGGIMRGLGGKILSKKTFTLNVFPGIEAQFSTPDKPQLPAVKFLRTVMVHGTAYAQQFWTSTEQESNTANARRRFFSSLQPKVQPVARVAAGIGANSRAYKLGKLMGSLAVYGLVIWAGFVFLRRLLKWSDKAGTSR